MPAIDKWWGRLSNLITVWPVLVPAGVVGAVAGYLSQGVDWISQFGAFGWLCAATFGALSTAAICALAAYARHKWSIASATARWAKSADSINPMDKEFRDLRIRMSDLANPVTKQIINKRFINCELIGPITLLLGPNELRRTGFIDVNMIPVKNNVPIHPIYTMIGCELIECQVMDANLIFPIEHVRMMEAGFPSGHLFYLSLTGVPEIDSRLPPGIALGTPL